MREIPPKPSTAEKVRYYKLLNESDKTAEQIGEMINEGRERVAAVLRGEVKASPEVVDEKTAEIMNLRDKIDTYYDYRMKVEIDKFDQELVQTHGRGMSPEQKSIAFKYYATRFREKVSDEYQVAILTMNYLMICALRGEEKALQIQEEKLAEILNKLFEEGKKTWRQEKIDYPLKQIAIKQMMDVYGVEAHLAIFEWVKDLVVQDEKALELFKSRWSSDAFVLKNKLLKAEQYLPRFNFLLECYKNGGKPKLDFLSAYGNIHKERVDWMKKITEIAWEDDAERFIKQHYNETRDFYNSTNETVTTEGVNKYLARFAPFYENKLENFVWLYAELKGRDSKQSKALLELAKAKNFYEVSVRELFDGSSGD